MPKTDKPLVKEYATEEIVVEWEPRLCFHSQNCVQMLPQVFDRNRRPWIVPDAASPEDVERTVAQCPSGALRSRRVHATGPKRQEPLEVRASPNGPLLIRGGVRIFDEEGNVLYEGDRAALCRCGGSANKPFCDGTHKTNGFEG